MTWQTDLKKTWPSYCPSEKAPWNLRRVIHLHHNAGFAATWDEIQRDLKDGPEASINRLLSGRARASGVPDEFEHTAAKLADTAVKSGDPNRLKAWWVYRMTFGPDPLTERLALFWHNHFATSNIKVKNLGAMHRQNEMFRRLARAPFGTVLIEAVRDPALLVWLDAAENKKDAPNENLARELMELFTLGIGHYTEEDVKQAAKALTGMTITDGKAQEDIALHATGSKTILGLSGPFRTKNLLRILLNQPATAERLADRLCTYFLGEKVADAEAVKTLAAALHERNWSWVPAGEPGNNLDIGWAVETLLRSERFFTTSSLGKRIQTPVEYVVGAVRVLEMWDAPPSTLVLADWAARLGQDLFYPPNVGGWTGGLAWVGSREMLGRVKFASELVEGKLLGRQLQFDALAFAERHGRKGNLEEILKFFAELLLGAVPDTSWVQRAAGVIRSGGGNEADMSRRAIACTLSCPETQLF
jgi:uncharacterized protein (DUF1800 family)